MAVYPGYRGIADIPTIGLVRFADANIAVRQGINAPDLIMGDWDHNAFNYAPITIDGTISGPVTETFVDGDAGSTDSVWEWACRRTGCGDLSQKDMTLIYYCPQTSSALDGTEFNAKLIEELAVNSMTVSCAAGDVAQFSIDVIAASIEDVGGNQGWTTIDAAQPQYHRTSAEKLVTWDKVSVSVASGSDGAVTGEDNIDTSTQTDIGFSNFEFTVNNNFEVVYAMPQTNLLPFAIVPGLRTITGTLTVYNTPRVDGPLSFDDYTADEGALNTLTFTLGSSTNDLIIDVLARFHRIEPSSSVGMVTSTIGFTGVGHQTGSAWT